MPKHKSEYETLMQNVVDSLKKSPTELHHIIETSKEVLNAASDMTKDEWALLSAYVESDVKEFAESFEESKSGPFYLTITNSIWQGLMDITDTTKVEWLELTQELEKRGLYEEGDMISLGVLVCEKCGQRTEYTHPSQVIACTACGNRAFHRQSMATE
ncbi:MAG: zinc ribbon-containing protein [Vibrio sp.]